MPREFRSLTVILAVIGTLWLANWLWNMASHLADIILLFFLAWLVAFTLSPLVEKISQGELAEFIAKGFRWLGAARIANRVQRFRLPRGLAVALMYLVLAVVLAMSGLILIPTVVSQLAQLAQLANRLPNYLAQAPEWLERLQAELMARGLEVDLTLASQLREQLLRTVQTGAARFAQNALGLATRLASLLADFFLVLILSFYMTLDGPRLSRRFLELVPPDWRDEAIFFIESVDQTFGGFVRGQLVMAVLSALGTMVIMRWAGLTFILAVSLFCGLVMLIPIVGAPVALFLPVILALIQKTPGTAFSVGLALFGLQQIVLHILMPRILSQAMGMHPLLVFAALLIGVRVAGFWGALFGIPVIGVVYAMAAFFYERALAASSRPTEPVRSHDG